MPRSLSVRAPWKCSLTVLGLIAGLAACERALFAPASSQPLALAVRYHLAPQFQTLGQANGSGAAFDRADHIWVRLSKGDTVLVDTTVAFTPAPEARVAVAVSLAGPVPQALLFFELRRGSEPLFMGRTRVDLTPGEPVRTDVALMPRPAQVRAAQDSTRVNALGDTIQLAGAAIFATGDTVSNATLTWSTSDTAVVSVSPEGRLVTKRNGEARVTGRVDAAGSLTATTTVRVAQVLAGVDLALDTVPMRQTTRAVAVDSNGVALQGSAATGLTWSSADSQVAQVGSDGGVTAKLLGVTSIAVQNTAASAASQIRVAPLLSGSFDQGGGHACALDAEGRAFCWGDNLVGQTGTGSMSNGVTAPTPVSTSQRFTQLSSEWQHTCGLTPSGDVYCWGANGDGQLGTGDTINSATPRLAARGFTAVDAGAAQTCGLQADGTAWCWGLNFRGQLGNGTTTSSFTPVQVSGGLTFRDIEAASTHSCGITTDGAAYCWGNNSLGHLGSGSTDSFSTVPVPVAGGLTFRSLNGGNGFVCGVTTTDEAWCWGLNRDGELGATTGTCQGSWVCSRVPVAVSGGLKFGMVGAGSQSTCGVTVSGEGYCWGNNSAGSLGNGSTASSTTPVPVTGGTEFVRIDTGWASSCGVARNGQLLCWGANGWGRLGDQSTALTPTPAAVIGSARYASVVTGDVHSCALAGDGTAHCWGSNGAGQLGISASTPEFRAEPAPVAGSLRFASLHSSAGSSTTCGLTSTGELFCWGANGSGQIGDGTTDTRAAPVRSASGLTLANATVGGAHTCAVSSGTIYCWGANASGQLGNGSTVSSSSPATLSGNFATLGAGSEHTCALTPQGEARCWGSNRWGQLGIGSSDTVPHATPVAVATGLSFRSLSVGALHTCGVTQAGEVHCWGNNSNGEFGDGTSPGIVPTPTRAGASLTFTSLQAGWGHTCGVTTGGESMCWGLNEEGALGDGTFTTRLTPTRITGGRTFTQVSPGDSHTCGIASDGSTLCWGYKGAGELGTGQLAFSTIPVTTAAPFRVATGTRPASGAARASHARSVSLPILRPGESARARSTIRPLVTSGGSLDPRRQWR